MNCQWCGDQLETRNRRARYCSASCRAHAHRNGPRVVQLEPKGEGAVTRAVKRELDSLFVGDTDLARAALKLAEAIDSPRTPPRALPGLTKELPRLLDYMRKQSATD